MKVELTRFKVKPGKSAVADEWMKTLNDRVADCLRTFEREHMYIEVIFRERQGEDDYLYWFSIQGEEGAHVDTSEHEIDKIHLQYWEEVIDRSYKPVDCELQVPMLPQFLLALMKPEILAEQARQNNL